MEKTLRSLCASVRIDCIYGAPENPDFRDSDAWTVTLKYQRRQMTIPFYMGRGHHGKEPDAETVLECLLSDASSVDCVHNFENWAQELGYDPDSRKAEKIYKNCQRISKRLRQFLGEDYESFMYADR